MAAKRKPKPVPTGKRRMLIELEEPDVTKLTELEERYKAVVGERNSSKVFVLRQLVRHAHLLKKLPEVL
jgi:hypothetical protein